MTYRAEGDSSIEYRDSRELSRDAVVRLYRENRWSAADKPVELHQALVDSHTLISAWDGITLVGIGNAISDGHLVVYYPHLLVLPDYQRRGIGREIVSRLRAKYAGFHQHVLVADPALAGFYEHCGFERAGETVPMWIYLGKEHGSTARKRT